ncbi:MAG: hypothetical protein KDG44_16815 [Burkholderiaceae bacterium]|jgi:hypothetical protein|nr:hypothetical protein [Burkholderiaceae bacterium]
MADIEQCQTNFGCGRVLRTLDLAGAKSTFTEVQRSSLPMTVVVYG